MPLHSAKRVAFLQLCNYISSRDLKAIKDLFDGEFFQSIISSIFGILFDAGKCDSVAAVPENDKNISSEELKVLPETADSETKDKIILEKFKFVQNFIDERYNTESEKLISYSDCMKGEELELAKVTIFILSEVVRHYVHTNNEHLKTLSHLDVKVQEDLQECFHLFIFERETLSQSKVEKVLSNPARYKTPSPTKASFVTPRRSCTSKYRLSSPSNEDIFTNSPLKSFFESPVFKKEDLLLKEKEITKTRKNLHQEEIKCDELQFELKDLKKQLKEKDKEIKKLKADRNKHEYNEDLLKYEEELKKLKDKCDSLEKEAKKKQKEHEYEITELFSKITCLQYAASINGKKISYRESDQKLEDMLIKKDLIMEKLETKLEYYKSKNAEQAEIIKQKDKDLEEVMNKKYKEVLERKDNELAALQDAYDELQFEVLKNESLYKESIDEITRQAEPPATGENIGVILEEENKSLRIKVKQLEEQLLQKNDMVKPVEICDPVIKNEFKVSLPELLNKAESLEAQKHNNLEKHFKNVEEVPDSLPDDCDFSSNSEVASKHSATSSHSEMKCLPDSSLTENTTEPVLESYGTLWKNLENSQLESEHSDTFENLNEYSQGNLLNKSCCNCNKIHLECESMKMAKEHEIQLELKDEEIDKLKINLETLQQNHLKELEEKNKTIEDLQTKLTDLNEENNKLLTALSEYKESLLSEKEKTKKYCELSKAFKDQELEKKKLQKEYKDVVETLNCSIREKIKIIYSLNIEIRSYNKKINSYQKRLTIVESEKEQVFKRMEQVKENYFRKSQELENIKARLKEQKIQKLTSERKDSYCVKYESTSKDICNESTMSGALCSKNGLQFVSQDEADYLNQSSLEEIKKNSEQDRYNEIIRRNSICPQHLRSSYPIELLHLPQSSDKFYQAQIEQTPKNENPGGSHQTIEKSKKRKHQELDSTLQSEMTSTPLAKMKKKFGTPSSFKTLFSRQRHHKGSIRPKPTYP